MVWPYVILSYYSLFVFGLCDNARGPLFTEILKAFHLGDAQGAWFFALSSAAGFLTSFFSRHLFKFFSKTVVVRGATFAMMLSLWGMAWSPYFYVFLIFIFIFGMSMGLLGLVPNILVNLGTPLNNRRQVLSGLHAMYGFASLLSPLFVALVAWKGGDWRDAFRWVSLSPLSLLIYSFFVPAKPLVEEKHPRTPQESVRQGFKYHAPQIFLAAMMSFYVMAEILISSRLALYVTREKHLSFEMSSIYVTYFFVCLLAGRLFFSFVKFAAPLRRQLSISLVISISLMFAGIYGHPLFFVLAGLSMAPFYPLTVALISEEFPRDLDSALSYLIGSDSLMLIVMHLLVGALTDIYGIAQAMLVGPAVLLMSLIMLNSFSHVFKRAR